MELFDFWIRVQDISDDEAKKLWLRHRNNTIHCTVFPDKTFIYGVATDKAICAIVDDINGLHKDYGLTRQIYK